jgi:hypothetical protein
VILGSQQARRPEAVSHNSHRVGRSPREMKSKAKAYQLLLQHARVLLEFLCGDRDVSAARARRISCEVSPPRPTRFAVLSASISAAS